MVGRCWAGVAGYGGLLKICFLSWSSLVGIILVLRRARGRRGRIVVIFVCGRHVVLQL